MQFDHIVRGGTVYDGSGSDPSAIDLGIDGDEIVAMGNLAEAEARASSTISEPSLRE